MRTMILSVSIILCFYVVSSSHSPTTPTPPTPPTSDPTEAPITIFPTNFPTSAAPITYSPNTDEPTSKPTVIMVLIQYASFVVLIKPISLDEGYPN